MMENSTTNNAATTTPTTPSFDREEEAELRHAENGVVGWTENDETYFDQGRRRKSGKLTAPPIPAGHHDHHHHHSGTTGPTVETEEEEEKSAEDESERLLQQTRLDFSPKLYGRSREIDLICQAYDRAAGPNETNNHHNNHHPKPNKKTNHQPQRAMVFLSGYSGCGKSALIETAVQQIQQKYVTPEKNDNNNNNTATPLTTPLTTSFSSILIQSKFDELQAPIPYKGIAEALRRWYRGMSSQERNVFDHQAVQAELQQAIGDDTDNLLNLLPSLAKLIVGNSGTTSDDGAASLGDSTLIGDSTVDQDAINPQRIRFAFKSLLQVMCKYAPLPLILWMDDLQWADSYTLDLVEYLLTIPSASSSSNNNHTAEDELQRSSSSMATLTGAASAAPLSRFMFVGSYRGDAIDEHHGMQHLLDKLEHQEQQQQQQSEPKQQPQSETAADATESANESHDKNKTNAALTCIHLSELKESDITEFISDTLELGVDQVLPLAKAIFERTLGNMFFTRQALEELVRQNALYFDMVTFTWQWALSAEKLAESLTGDILQMVTSKIKSVPDALQRVLVVASYAKPTFDAERFLTVCNAALPDLPNMSPTQRRSSNNPSTLPLTDMNEVVAEQSPLENTNEYNHDALVSVLQQGVNEGLLETIMAGSTSNNNNNTGSRRDLSESAATTSSAKMRAEYTFAHDRIREVANTFVSGEALDKLLFNVGNALVEDGMENSVVVDDSTFFLGMRHLNMVPEKFFSNSDKVRLARLSLNAAKESSSKAAFANAQQFSEKGIALLTDRGWETNRELMHDLHLVAAEASRCSGDMERMEQHCNAFLKAEERQPMDSKFQVYYTLATGLFSGTDRHEEAKQIFLKLLEHHGCRFPKNPVIGALATVKEFVALLLFKKKWRTNLVNELPLVSDRAHNEVMQILAKLVEVTYLLQDDILGALVLFRGLNLTLKHGVALHSPYMVAGVAILFSGLLRDLSSGQAYAEYGLQLMRRVNYKPNEPGVVMVLYATGFAWCSPTRECIRPLRENFQVGVNNGKHIDASWCIVTAWCFEIVTGGSLARLDLEFRRGISRFEDLGHRMQLVLTTFLWLAVLDLRGLSAEKADAVIAGLTEEERESSLSEWQEGMKRISLGYLGAHEQCADSMIKHSGGFLKAAPGDRTPALDVCVSAVSCLQMFRETRKKKYYKEAKKIHTIISDWSKQGDPNMWHWNTLLIAEFAVAKRHHKFAEKKYRLANEQALEGRFNHDAALINERWGAFALEVMGKDEQARELLQEAVNLYTAWGALEKVRRLKEKYPVFLSNQKRRSVNPRP